MQNRSEARQFWALPEDAYVIGTVGRLEKVKNYTFLMDVFEKVLQKKENSYLVFVGDGSQRQELIEKAERKNLTKRVLFLGNRSNLEQIYPIFDIFVSTSQTEASPLVTLEAQAAGLKCVVSEACPKESVFTNQVVRMDEMDSMEAWAQQIVLPSKWSRPYSKEEDYLEYGCKRKMKEIYTDIVNGRRNDA